MARIITVAQQKGGTGKTALTAHLAALWAATMRLTIIDTDPQRSLTRWHGLRAARPKPPPPIVLETLSGWRVGGALDRWRREAEIILVDTPPQIETEVRAAVRAADLVLIPLLPSPPDLWAAEATLALAAAERRPVRLVFNRAPVISRLRAQLGAEIARRGLALAAAALGNRQAFAVAFAAGLGVTEAAPRSPAAVETAALASELLKVFD